MKMTLFFKLQLHISQFESLNGFMRHFYYSLVIHSYLIIHSSINLCTRRIEPSLSMEKETSTCMSSDYCLYGTIVWYHIEPFSLGINQNVTNYQAWI